MGVGRPYQAMVRRDWVTLEKCMTAEPSQHVPLSWLDYALRHEAVEAALWLAVRYPVAYGTDDSDDPETVRRRVWQNVMRGPHVALRQALTSQSLGWRTEMVLWASAKPQRLTRARPGLSLAPEELDAMLAVCGSSCRLTSHARCQLVRELLTLGARPAVLEAVTHAELFKDVLYHPNLVWFREMLALGFVHLFVSVNNQPLLHWCASHGHLAQVKELLARGARLSALNHDGLTAAEYASQSTMGQACAVYLVQLEHDTAVKVKAPEEGEVQPRGTTCCSVCLKGAMEVVLKPCRHVATCTACTAHLRHCPVCRAPIVSSEKVYCV